MSYKLLCLFLSPVKQRSEWPCPGLWWREAWWVEGHWFLTPQMFVFFFLLNFSNLKAFTSLFSPLFIYLLDMTLSIIPRPPFLPHLHHSSLLRALFIPHACLCTLCHISLTLVETCTVLASWDVQVWSSTLFWQIKYHSKETAVLFRPVWVTYSIISALRRIHFFLMIRQWKAERPSLMDVLRLCLTFQ